VTGLNGVKRSRQRAIREVVAREAVTSQQELAERLAERGFSVTQATVSRDIAELGLVKIARGDRHVYVAPEDIAAPPSAPAGEERLRRILSDIPVSVGRSGLIVVLTGAPGTASVIAQAIDESNLAEQEGTLAGDNTLLVLFADEARLERWLARFRRLQALIDPETSAISAGPVSGEASSPIPMPSRR
jgi:transcriptional regulator of arginine metabolism